MTIQKKTRLLAVWCCILSVIWVGAWVDTLRVDTPANSDSPSEADDRMREIKGALVERLDVDHYFTASASNTYDAADTGLHRFVTFAEPNDSVVTVAANQGVLFTKDASAVAELHWIDENENELQVTAGGKFNFTGSTVPDDAIDDGMIRLANNAYLVASNAAGNGEVSLIRASTANKPEIPAGAVLSTSAAPTVDAGLANKLYVDNAKPDKYNSGWFAVAGATTYTKAHSLGGIPDIVQVWYSNTSDGTGDVVLQISGVSGVGVGSYIIENDATNVKVRTDNYVADYYNASGVRQLVTTGWLKIVAVKFN